MEQLKIRISTNFFVKGAIQIAYTSPLFIELGVPTTLVSLVWLAGPISGLLVQPIVGVLSDR
jgi:solute carrier family 45 protein 1/2/4